MFHNLNMPEYKNLKNFMDSCISFFEKNKEKINIKSIKENRKKLSIYIEKFHTKSGTLTPKVKEKIMILRQEEPIILMTAHQPNLFPYSGVMRKATLIFTLGREIERRLGTKIVNFFGIADQDFTDDRWIKSSLLPSITRKNGILTLSVDLPKKTMLNNVPKPSINKINKWKIEIETWLNNAIYTINKFCKENRVSNWNSKESLLHHNFETFWEIVKDSHDRSTTYSDFNSFIMSKIINEAWGCDILFSRYSDCQKIFVNEFNYLLTNFSDYSSTLKETSKLFHKKEGKKEIIKEETDILPFWYHCNCGSKARLYFCKKENSMIGHGFCLNCSKEFNINLGKVDEADVSTCASNISARAIPMILVFSKGLGLTGYVGGIGGIEYLNEAICVAKKIDISLPPIAFWRPHDKYLGISQLEAILEYKRITGNYEINKCKVYIEQLKYDIKNVYDEISYLELKKIDLINNLKSKSINMKIFKKDLKEILNEIT
ncbi:MAG: hypothetical protein ACFFDN_29190, partial [Candidatus Hodarchaeota archaeon]